MHAPMPYSRPFANAMSRARTRRRSPSKSTDVLDSFVATALSNANHDVGPATASSDATLVEQSRDPCVEADSRDIEEMDDSPSCRRRWFASRRRMRARARRAARVALLGHPPDHFQIRQVSARASSTNRISAPASLVDRAVSAPHDYKIDIRRCTCGRKIARMTGALGEMNLR